jgi:septal ring factor EnvC (AmiA/AmiB activator)
VEHEQLFPGRQTYARYLHVAEAAAEDEAQAAWDGLGGRLKALRREVVDVKAGQAEVKADVADVKADIEEVKDDVAEVKAGQMEVKADVAEVKALLEKLVAQSLPYAA